MIGGIDLGGTKIEARLFDDAVGATHETRRIATPTDSYDSLCEALERQIDWLEEVSGDRSIAVGISVPGLIDPETGESFASNVPTTGHSLAATLLDRRGRSFEVVNDCMAFTLSESRGGSADGHDVVMGLILGTGVGGGIAINGTLPPRHAGLAVEVGHLGASARALVRHGLPLFACGCGRVGCVETYISGTGLSNIAEWKTGHRVPAHEIENEDVLDVWADVTGDTLAAIQIMLDPSAIVLGGGVSNMAGISERLSAALAENRLGHARAPQIMTAQHGDASGARGAAVLAKESRTP